LLCKQAQSHTLGRVIRDPSRSWAQDFSRFVTFKWKSGLWSVVFTLLLLPDCERSCSGRVNSQIKQVHVLSASVLENVWDNRIRLLM
jgi:hypothetical protein